MFSGAQISLYPMCDDFVSLILGSLSALDPYRPQLRIETDDISTLLVGPPEVIFQAMRDLFVAVAKSGKHVVMHATISRGCPGEPDAEICQPSVKLGGDEAGESEKIEKALQVVKQAKETGQEVSHPRTQLNTPYDKPKYTYHLRIRTVERKLTHTRLLRNSLTTPSALTQSI